MNGRYGSDDLEDMRESAPAADREVSLGTGAMLGIFLALVVVCGAFFGFGYSMGHKAGPIGAPGAAAVGDADASGPVAAGGGKPTLGDAGVSDAPEVVVKPSAGSGVRAGAAAGLTKVDTGAEAPARPAVKPVAKPNMAVSNLVKPAVAGPNEGATSTSPAAALPSPSAATAATPGTPQTYVQISAVSHQEDAQLLMTALKRRGYEATVRHSPQDQLLHVQVGPYATKKDADAMRQRLSADGYNAILK